jgi:hypothetical protein
MHAQTAMLVAGDLAALSDLIKAMKRKVENSQHQQTFKANMAKFLCVPT